MLTIYYDIVGNVEIFKVKQHKKRSFLLTLVNIARGMLQSSVLSNAHFVLFYFLCFPYTEWKILLQN